MLLLFQHCSSPQPVEEKESISIPLDYAKGFTISELQEGYLLEILRPYPGSTQKVSYYLSEQEDVDSEHRFIKVPVESFVCTSTTHLPMLDYLGESNKLIGFPTTDYVSSVTIRKRIDEGLVMELGSVVDMNVESLLELDPNLIVNYSMDDLKKTTRLESLGLKVLLNGDYLEDHPLGRAEWIKVFGLLTGKMDMADSIFNSVKNEYLKLKSLGSTTDYPCVFSGSLYGDTWYMPGGNNYAAKLLQDAGFQYVLASDNSYGFLQWSYESVYEVAKDCEYWISPAPFPKLEALENSDERYDNFAAFDSGKVFVYDNQIGATGGNQYLELGYLRPDIILKDLVKIRDPEQFEGYSLFFYRQLE